MRSRLQSLRHGVPGLRIDDGLVLSRVDLPAVSNLTGVDPAAQQVIDRAAGERLFRSGPKLSGLEMRANRSHISQLEVLEIDVLQHFGLGGIDEQLTILDPIAKRDTPAHPHAFFL